MGNTDAPAAKAAPSVAVRGLHKRFGNTRALVDVNLVLQPGEIHCIAGVNGAGKSTLLKILAGVHQPDRGEIQVAGKSAVLADPRAAIRAGIITIHQELPLVGAVSVSDNLLLSEDAPGWSLLAPLSAKRRRARARAMLAAVELDIDPDVAVETLPLAARQLIVIARALAAAPRVLVLDEPTSALADEDARELADRLLALRDTGVAIAYVSHRLSEVIRLTDRLTVLRDGAVVHSGGGLTRAALVAAMTGSATATTVSAASHVGTGATAAATRRPGVVGFRARQLSARGLTVDALELDSGAITGVTGLRGSGMEQLASVLYGLEGSGEVSRGSATEASWWQPSPATSLAHGVAFLSGDRERSLVASQPVFAAGTLAALPRFSPGGWLRPGSEREAVQPVADEVALATTSLSAVLSQLSGGNQQKVALIQARLAEPRVLLCFEPTRGIDVAAKASLHAQLRRLARERVVLYASGEMEDVVALAERVLVMAEGRIVADLWRPDRVAVRHAALYGEAP